MAANCILWELPWDVLLHVVSAYRSPCQHRADLLSPDHSPPREGEGRSLQSLSSLVFYFSDWVLDVRLIARPFPQIHAFRDATLECAGKSNEKNEAVLGDLIAAEASSFIKRRNSPAVKAIMRWAKASVEQVLILHSPFARRMKTFISKVFRTLTMNYSLWGLRRVLKMSLSPVSVSWRKGGRTGRRKQARIRPPTKFPSSLSTFSR